MPVLPDAIERSTVPSASSSSARCATTTVAGSRSSATAHVFEPPRRQPVGGRRPAAARTATSCEVLVDGERAIGEICAALKQARSHVHIAGWHVTPAFELERDGGSPTTLRDLLAELAERVDVRVLVWAGPPAPVFEPKRSDVKRIRDELTRGTRIRCVLDARERTMHCHHEKLVIVDDEVAFVGGIDLTSLSGDRWDTTSTRPHGRLGWHDVATRLRGPAVADVAEHFRRRWQEVPSEPLPPPRPQPPAGETTVQVLRTVPDGTYDFVPRGDFRILDAYVRALRSAQRLIYLENQFLWSTEIAEILAAQAARTRRATTSALVLLLPARPNNGADTTRGQLGRLIEADGRGRPAAGGDDQLPQRHADASALRAREGRDRRRPLADDRLREPQRALALQRHRDERR